MFLLILGIGGDLGGQEATKEPPALPDFDSLWNFEDPAETEGKFRDLLPMIAGSGNLSAHAQLLTQIARAEGLQNRFEDAHQTLDAVESILTKDLVLAKVRYLLERGRVYNSSKEVEKSKPFFLEAWDLARSAGEDYYAVDAAHMMGIVEPPEKQLEWAEKSMDLAEHSSKPKAKEWLGPLYNNTGWSYHDLGQYDKALELFEKSLKWREERKDEGGTLIARWTIGRAYRSLGRIEEALEIQKRLESEGRAGTFEWDGYVYEEIAECLLLLHREEESRPYFRRAHEIHVNDLWLVVEEPKRLERLKELGAGGAP